MNSAGFYIIHDTGKSHWHKDLCVNYVTTLSARNFMMLLLNPSNKKEITKLPTVKSNSPLTQKRGVTRWLTRTGTITKVIAK